MSTISKYGKPKARKIITSSGVDGNGNRESESRTIAGTAVTDTSVATTAARGGVGTTTLNSNVHVATHDRPTHVWLAFNPAGWRNSAAAMP